MKAENIRNFCIIAHIDHGKSTLADRLLELTGSVRYEEKSKQVLDSMDLEKERGITIKLKAIRMKHKIDGLEYELNLIDTPGHVDFGYEVSRSLAACEGALLLVDASQGVQAQTIVNLEKARHEGLKILPVVNKIDLPSAEPEACAIQLIELGFKEEDIYYTSAKTGEGVDKLLSRIVTKIPAPESHLNEPSRALIFDSIYDDYRGVVAFVRVIDGSFKTNSKIKFIASKAVTKIVELGYLSPKEVLIDEITAGEVGFIATGLKQINEVRVGDTICLDGESPKAIPGYKEPIPVVYLSFYPEDTSKYLDLREAFERLSLNDAAFTFEPESIGSIGKGFRCGFLGLLHADIIKERVEREFDVDVVTTSPSVRYLLTTTSNEEIEIKSASEYPDVTYVKEVKEPWTQMSIYTPTNYMSAIMDLCKSRRAEYISTEQMDTTRMKIIYDIPLIEIIVDFYDKLKSISSGYASIDYKLTDYRKTEVSRMDILVAGEEIMPLSQLVQRHMSVAEGLRVVAKLKELIPRQQFKVSLQAAIGGKIIAREDISPMRKDVTGYLYGGDITRKMKLLEKQKKGKKRMKRFGSVDIPQDVFWKVMEK